MRASFSAIKTIIMLYSYFGVSGLWQVMVQEMKKLLHKRQKLFRLANRNTQRLKKKRLLLCLAQATFAYTS